jgi:hypothetical protein
MLGHRAKIITETGDFVFGVQGALGVSPLPPAVQDEAVRIEFLDRQGVRCRYVFGTSAEFFRTIEEAAVRVDEQNAGTSVADLDDELSVPAAGAPRRFRELVAHALGTTDSTVRRRGRTSRSCGRIDGSSSTRSTATSPSARCRARSSISSPCTRRVRDPAVRRRSSTRDTRRPRWRRLAFGPAVGDAVAAQHLDVGSLSAR